MATSDPTTPLHAAAQALLCEWDREGAWQYIGEHWPDLAAAKADLEDAVAQPPALPQQSASDERAGEWVTDAMLTAGINAKVQGYGDDPGYPPVVCDYIDSTEEVERIHGLDRDVARSEWTDAFLTAVYRAMIAAAPAPPAALSDAERALVEEARAEAAKPWDIVAHDFQHVRRLISRLATALEGRGNG